VYTWYKITAVEEVMRGMDDVVCQGKVLYIGMSDVPAWWVAQANALAQLRRWLSFNFWFGTACGRSLGRRARSD
jgi:aryl-alcohol dehydrogenase-like predicted oxidoreductase